MKLNNRKNHNSLVTMHPKGRIKISLCPKTSKWNISIRDSRFHTEDNYLGFIAKDKVESRYKNGMFINYLPRALPKTKKLFYAVLMVLDTTLDIIGATNTLIKTDDRTYWICYYD